MKGSSPHGLWKYATRRLRWAAYLRAPGDGRSSPQIPAQALLWSLLMGCILRQSAFRAIEAWVGSSARRALGVRRAFSDDALRYFTERLNPAPSRAALASALRRSKRNKTFEGCRFVGLALGGPLTLLPADVEPYGPGDIEYAAGQRLLRRVRASLGARFVDYMVVDGEFATAPFLHTAGEVGWPVVARLKENLPELFQAAQRRFRSEPPHLSFRGGPDRVELWDADDFDPWDTLRWESVRVIRYRQHHADGETVEAYRLTNLPSRRISRRSLYGMAKSRWRIENQGFNDAKNRYGLEHICDHHSGSLLIVWLLTCLALERLYRLRYLHRGTHPARTAIDQLRFFLLTLSAPACRDSS